MQPQAFDPRADAVDVFAQRIDVVVERFQLHLGSDLARLLGEVLGAVAGNGGASTATVTATATPRSSRR